ncbi:hypothetical protein QBC45DRAFT_321497 [Copromyces sp. CBS 386.78]|nr:hypothetical protein QBC45DRAFT_321497 [Copromyces sp. CBS 386.78]
MPRFSVAFGRRKSTAENADNAPAESSFRVLERPDAGGNKFHEAGKSFDGTMKLGGKAPSRPKTSGSDIHHDNLFAGINRGSASSSTTKATSTDNSSRHSNSSTAPSSADSGDVPVPPIPKSSSGGFLKAAGRTFSFGGGKKPLPIVPAEQEPVPQLSSEAQDYNHVLAPTTRPRATTTSTSTTVTPPRVDDDLGMDLGGDFGKMVLGNEKRASMVGNQNNQNSQARQPGLGPRSLTGNRLSQPSPIQVDRTAKIEPAQPSWTSQHSNDQLLSPTSPPHSPRNKEVASPLSRHMSPLAREAIRPSASPESNPRKPLLAHRNSDAELGEGEDEEARLLMDSLSTVTKYMDAPERAAGSASGPSSGSRYRRGGNGLPSGFKDTALGDDDSLFDTNHSYAYETTVSRNRGPNSQSQGANKVMTPAEFEKYRKDKERQDRERQMEIARNQDKSAAGEDDEEDNYDDEEDDLEKARQQAKQRKKQEAHMSVYRQQMMKVTGEAANAPMPRPNLQMSFSTPNLQNPATGPATSDNSDEDEEVPLAILAAHGFPSKNRPPTRLSTMMSNPNLRAAQEPSYQRPGSAAGGAMAAGGHLPAFARNLPQDPFIGAGLARNNPRENFGLGGGSPAPINMNPAGPPGGLIGVIASEERARAMRRGSPHIPEQRPISGAATFDPIAGIPPHMLYPNKPNLTAGDQAQIQMTQQMQQFMQMQMQFMQMMAGQNGTGAPRPEGHMATGSIGSIGSAAGMPGFAGLPPMPGVPGGLGLGGPDMRHSFMGNESMLDLPPPRGDTQMRTMSMVQPSSASWIHPQQPAGFAPSVRVTGGYAPSIAPSERSNVGLPGRYRPVSQVAPPALPTMPTAQPLGASHMRKSSTMSGANQPTVMVKQSGSASDDDDDEQGWEAMKAKREKKRSLWKRRKSVGGDAGTILMSK